MEQGRLLRIFGTGGIKSKLGPLGLGKILNRNGCKPQGGSWGKRGLEEICEQEGVKAKLGQLGFGRILIRIGCKPHKTKLGQLGLG